MNNLNQQLARIRHLLNRRTESTEISEDQILAYTEDRLSSEELDEIQCIISHDPQLLTELIVLRDLVQQRPMMAPPPDLSAAVIQTLGLANPPLMDLALQRIKGMWRIVSGEDLLDPVSASLGFSTRGSEYNLLVFKKEIPPYQIFCNLQPHPGGQLIFFALQNQTGESIRNGRFALHQGDESLADLLTDKTGATDQQLVGEGHYEIKIHLGKEDLGSIKLNIA